MIIAAIGTSQHFLKVKVRYILSIIHFLSPNFSIILLKKSIEPNLNMLYELINCKSCYTNDPTDVHENIELYKNDLEK